MHSHSTPQLPEGEEWTASSKIITVPLGLLAETFLVTQAHWETLPAPIPLFLHEALTALLEAQS